MQRQWCVRWISRAGDPVKEQWFSSEHNAFKFWSVGLGNCFYKELTFTDDRDRLSRCGL